MWLLKVVTVFCVWAGYFCLLPSRLGEKEEGSRDADPTCRMLGWLACVLVTPLSGLMELSSVLGSGGQRDPCSFSDSGFWFSVV